MPWSSWESGLTAKPWYFLLQSWRSEMQFVDIRADYLINSEAVFVFSVEEQSTFGDCLPTGITKAKYAETYVDGEDIGILEGEKETLLFEYQE
jgi:hypothetical protein